MELKVHFLEGTPTTNSKNVTTKEKIEKAVSREELITQHKNILDVIGSACQTLR